MPNFNYQIRLNTRILDSKGQVLPVRVDDASNCSYRIFYKNKEIGCVSFTVKDDCIYIDHLGNYTVGEKEPLKHVGSALFECVFNKSLELDKHGNIELYSTQKSGVAYYKMGLRAQSCSYNILQKKIKEFNATEDPVTKSSIKCDIEHDSSYGRLKEQAAYYLKKYSDITFDEAIKYGKYSSASDEFGEFLKCHTDVSKNDCYQFGMQGYMYLPQDSIDNNIKKFSIYQFCPIGSNLTGANLLLYGHTYRQLPDERLKKCVEEKTLDPANAMEIAIKYDSLSEKQKDLILSPIGLELMSKNYISAWYMIIYFSNKLKTIVSEKCLKAFENGTVSHINDYVNDYSNKLDTLLLGEGSHQTALVDTEY